MSIDEVIEKLEKDFEIYDNTYTTSMDYIQGYEYGKDCAVLAIKDYKKEQAVEIPRIVADWIDLGKKEKWNLIDCFDENYEFWVNDDEACPDSECDKWVRRNSDLFARAWLNGYTVKEEPKKFEVGEYYSFDEGKKIFRIQNSEDGQIDYLVYDVSYDTLKFWGVSKMDLLAVFPDSILATDEEIALFQRAEMYHARGRKLDELKDKDILLDVETGYLVIVGNPAHWEAQVIAGEYELYLTVEEMQKAHGEVTE